MNFFPVVICGGQGSRLWPASRSNLPKPFVRLPGRSYSLIASTYRRLAHSSLPPARAILTVTGKEYIHLTERAYAESGIGGEHIVLGEPCARNTAAAIAAAAQVLARRAQDDDAVMLVLPADHVIDNPDAFVRAASAAAEAARHTDDIVLLGIPPVRAETRYGYIEALAPDARGVCAVSRFIEKPDSERASALAAQDNVYWNGGMFCMRVKTALAALAQHAPDISDAVAAAFEGLDCAAPVITADAESYQRIPSQPFDYAVMEKTPNSAVVVAGDMGWSDIGTWAAVAQLVRTDDDGNAADGDVRLFDCKNSFISANNRLVVGMGLENACVVDTPDALFVSTLDAAEGVRTAVAALQERAQVHDFPTVFKPWGSYTVLSEQPGYKLKRIDVNPGAMLSYQSHQRRSEHWTVVEGVMNVVLEGEETALERDQSCYIPVGAKHRMLNKTAAPAALIEVQVGDYLGEDDIIRYTDIYGRADS